MDSLRNKLNFTENHRVDTEFHKEKATHTIIEIITSSQLL
jgi:2-methylcitrate dehydratase PrpD